MTAFAREIDPHYLSPRNTEQFNTEMSLSLEGIGAVCKWMTIILSLTFIGCRRPRRRGRSISVGDRIVGVGRSFRKPMIERRGWRLDDVVALIKGKRQQVRREYCRLRTARIIADA